MSTEDNWICAKERLPDALEVVCGTNGLGHKLAVFRSNGRWVQDARNPVARVEVMVTHWQPFPKLPPKPDAFEEWWSEKAGCAAAITIDTSKDRFSLIHREAAKQIWDAAIASAKDQR